MFAAGSDCAAKYNVKAVPAEMNYTCWVWSRDNGKVQQCIRDYLFWQHTTPNLLLTINLDENAETPILQNLELDLHFTGITDESTVETQYDNGLYYVAGLGVKLDGWEFDVVQSKVAIRLGGLIFDKGCGKLLSTVVVCGDCCTPPSVPEVSGS